MANQPHPSADPVYIHSRRESWFIIAIWAVFACWILGVSYAYGYTSPGPEGIQTVFGFPAWVFWAIALPWIVANIVTVLFCCLVMKDDPLGENHPPSAD